MNKVNKPIREFAHAYICIYSNSNRFLYSHERKIKDKKVEHPPITEY